MEDAEVRDLKFDTSVDKQLLKEPTSPCPYLCTAGGVGSGRPQTALGCCCSAESSHTGCQTYHPPSGEV